MIQDTSNVPHHLSESLFRYFEPNIALAVRNWPKETAFDLTMIPVADRFAASTFVARFRDAILSLKRFKWETTLIDLDKLWSMSGKFCIWIEPKTGVVWFKGKEKHQRPSHLIGEARQRAKDHAEEVLRSGPVLQKDLTANELEAFCLLLSGKRIEGPIRVLGNLHELFPEDIDVYAASLDVAFTWDPKTNSTVIT